MVANGGETRSEVHGLQVTRTDNRSMTDNVTAGPASLPAARFGSYNCSSSSIEWIHHFLAQRRKPKRRVGRTGWIPGRRLRSTSTAVFGRFIAGRRTRAYPFTGINTRNSARCSRTKASSTPGSAREARIRTSESRPTRLPQLPNPSLTVALTLAAAAVVIGVSSYLIASRSHADRTQGKTPVAGLELISTFAGSHRWPSLSPDGRMVAFISDAAGTPQVWVKNLGGGVPIQITFGDLPALRPRWSAHGDRIIYSMRGGGIWSVAPLGGEPRRIVENGWNADLSPDGQRLVFERYEQVLTAKADGSEVDPAAGPSTEVHPLLRRRLADFFA